MNAPVGMGNVAGMTLEAPLETAEAADPLLPLDAGRFDLPFAPAELFAGAFGAVVFAITLFLCYESGCARTTQLAGTPKRRARLRN